MSIEQALAELTAAVKENTTVQSKIVELAESAAKARGNTEEPKKPATRTAAKAKAAPKEEPKEEPAAEEEKPAPKKPATRARKPAAKKAKEHEVRVGISVDDVRDLARKHASNDGGDKEERERLKGLMSSAFDHLGVSKLSDMDDEERVKFAHYLDHWIDDSQQTLDFEALDEKVLAAVEAAGDGEEEDDMLD